MNDISKEETEERLRALANSKAAGLDFIPVELLKRGDAMVLELTKIASMVWNTLKFPCEINCGAIIRLQKRRNLPEHDHWRGVTFLIIVTNVMPSPAEMVRKAHWFKIKWTGWLWIWWIFQCANLYSIKHHWATIRQLWTTDYQLCRFQKDSW